MTFSEHQSITTSEPVTITDVSNDVERELEFHRQALSAVQDARKLLRAESAPFTRPTDYFAEMVKADEHMAKINAKMIDEAASKKASADARKQRDLKKFGKQVQVAKLQEREKEKKQTMEKIKILKRSKLLLSHLFIQWLANMATQNVKAEIMKPLMRQSSSMLHWKKRPNRPGKIAKVLINVIRRTRSLVSEAKKDLQRVAMRYLVVI
jgi:hypothetical protein